MNYNMTKRLFTKSRGINEITKKLIKNSNFTGEIENIDYCIEFLLYKEILFHLTKKSFKLLLNQKHFIY